MAVNLFEIMCVASLMSLIILPMTLVRHDPSIFTPHLIWPTVLDAS